MGRQEGKGDEAFLLGTISGFSGDETLVSCAESHSGVEQWPNDSATSSNSPAAVTWRSLPNKKQVLFLGICRLAEPLSSTALLAYVFYLLKSALSTSDPTPYDAQIAHHSGFLIAV